jgi:hypothetical protein
MSGALVMATKKAQIAHAKRKWDAELEAWNELFEAYYQLGKTLSRQRERISEAHKRYKELLGE